MTNEELFEQYVNGNYKAVQEALSEMEPLEAAAAAVRMYQELDHNDGILDCTEETPQRFALKLNMWSGGSDGG